MRQTHLFTFVVALIALEACTNPGIKSTTAIPRPGESYQSMTDDGAWCWFSDPRAIYYEGKHRRTYTGWVDSTGSIVVSYYDHRNGEIKTHVLHEKFERDDHDNPSFFMDAEGKLMVFYSRHSKRTSPIFLARAAKPESITEWQPTTTLSLNDTIAYAGYSNTYTYTNIVQLSKEENRLYLFWRGADFKPNFSMSADGGNTWDKGRILALPERIYRDRRPYMKVSSNGKDVIHFAFTDGHPNAEPTNSIYYMKYQRGALYKANGQKILDWKDTPVDPSRADLVYDASPSHEKAWIWDVAENKNGNPVVVYVKFPTDTSHVYYYSVHDGNQWREHRMADAGSWFPHTKEGTRERETNYSGGIVLDHNDPSNVYVSREIDGIFEIEHWSTADDGAHWNVRPVTRKSKFDNVRPFVVRNHANDSARLLWMNIQRYIHYTDYHGGIKISVIPDTQETARR